MRRLFAVAGLLFFHNPALLRSALALGLSKPPAGMYVVKGDVRVNGIAAQAGSVVTAGDTVTTGADAMAIFLIGKDVYLVRDNTRLELDSESAEALKVRIADVLRIVNGKMLSVFGKGRKRLVMPTAVAGVRGSGVYVEADPQRIYICTCYGIAEITPLADPSKRQTVNTFHHEAPRFVYASGAVSPNNRIIVKAPVINHTDAELIHLESLVYRQPPFVSRRGSGNGNGGGGGY
ncbi:MAG: hypothetical protein AMJ54_13625 [Deltaproteobacteria bacterium SG8_13]|nr:MAG: hypothetical protein AMJ54_13625 [Deltaproteobacteria bacterium SG8_13]